MKNIWFERLANLETENLIFISVKSVWNWLELKEETRGQMKNHKLKNGDFSAISDLKMMNLIHIFSVLIFMQLIKHNPTIMDLIWTFPFWIQFLSGLL